RRRHRAAQRQRRYARPSQDSGDSLFCVAQHGRSLRAAHPAAAPWTRILFSEGSTPMAIVDERGRLGGKVNLIDAVVAFLILILIPVAFGAYLLFRTPTPKLTALNPPALNQGPNLRIEV